MNPPYTSGHPGHLMVDAAGGGDAARVDISLATQDDLPDLARLLWLHATPAEQAEQAAEAFADDLRGWWSTHRTSHLTFIARLPSGHMVGMAWLALVPRVPRPGTTSRTSGDVQSVFVLPEQRGRGIGSALVEAASARALAVGASSVTVQSSRRAAPLYERLGFASSPLLLQRPGTAAPR